MHSPILFVQCSSVHAFIGVSGRLQSPACCIHKLYVKVVVAVAVLYGKVVVVLYCSTVRYVQVVVVLKVKFKMQARNMDNICTMHGTSIYNTSTPFKSQQPFRKNCIDIFVYLI
jgi:hypothetical protein